MKVIKVQQKIRKAYLYHLWLLSITVMKHLNRSLTSQMLPMTHCIPAGGEKPHQQMMNPLDQQGPTHVQSLSTLLLLLFLNHFTSKHFLHGAHLQCLLPKQVFRTTMSLCTDTYVQFVKPSVLSLLYTCWREEQKCRLYGSTSISHDASTQTAVHAETQTEQPTVSTCM